MIIGMLFIVGLVEARHRAMHGQPRLSLLGIDDSLAPSKAMAARLAGAKRKPFVSHYRGGMLLVTYVSRLSRSWLCCARH